MNTVGEMKDKGTSSGTTMMRMYNVRQYYKILQKVGRGTYGTVYKAKGLKDGRYYAIKKLQNNDTKLQQEGFPITALREITLLKQIDHPNIIKLKEIIVSRPNKRNLFRGSTFLLFEYMDHDFAGLFKMKIKYTTPEIKAILKQLLEGLAYLHKHKILHRDIKSANILLNDDGEVKLADFGLGRKVRFENLFTYKVVTLWYRAPELLLGLKTYSDKIDVWSLGCVVAEFFTGEVLFRKQTEFAQMERIYQIVGDFQANGMVVTDESSKIYHNFADFRPRKSYTKQLKNYLKKHCPTISQLTIDFIEGMLHLDPSKRMSCEEALRHPFFSERPLACSKSDIQKMDYQCHEMFKDRSIKIERVPKREHDNEEKYMREKENRNNRYERQGKRYEARQYPRERRERDDRNYLKKYPKEDPAYRKKDNRYKEDRRPYNQTKRPEKYPSSYQSSDSENSHSFSSSSRSSQYSSSQRTPRSRSRYEEHRRKQERVSRQAPKSRQNLPRFEREEKRRYQRREDTRHQKVDKRIREDRYRESPEEKRYKPNYPQRKRHEGQAGRQYRDQRHLARKEERRFDSRDQKKEEYQRKSQKREQRHSLHKTERRQDRKIDTRDYRDKREHWRRDSKQRKPERYEKPGYGSKDAKYYQQREYKRKEQAVVEKDQKYGRGERDQKYPEKYSKGEGYSKRGQQRYSRGDQKYSKAEQKYSRHDKYQEHQKHGDYVRRDQGERRSDKFEFVRQKPPYKKKDHADSQSSDGSARFKKDRGYSKQPKPYYERHQRKHYYKKQHQGSNDHRNH